MLPTLWQQLGEDPFLFQNDNAPEHKARSIQEWCVEIGVEELDRPAQSPDLNLIEHLSEDSGILTVSQASSPNISSQPH